MANNAELDRVTELLRAASYALNAIPNHRLDHPQFKDTYTLARDIRRFFKDVQDGAYREE